MLELREIPYFAAALRTARGPSAGLRRSPSRGKLRVGKELIILTDDRSQDGDRSVTSDSGDNNNNNNNNNNHETRQDPAAIVTTKKLSSLPMMERQAEWMKRRQEKVDAERQRLEEEKDKELTFQPKVTRRAAMFNEKPGAVVEELPPPRPNVRHGSFSAGPNRRLPVDKDTSLVERKPKVPPRPQSSSYKKKKSVPTTQAL